MMVIPAQFRRGLALAFLYCVGVFGIVASGGGGGDVGDVGNPSPLVIASFTVTPSTGSAPFDAVFNGGTSATSQGTLTAYEWNFGDGVTLTTVGPMTTHRYTSAGTYTARLTVRASGGGSDTATRTVTVTAPQQAIWLGGYESDRYPDSAVRADLTRSGDMVSGTYEDDSGRTGAIDITIDGLNVTAQFLETTPGCTGSFTGTGSYDASLGAGLVLIAFSGSNCDGQHTAGEFALIEQLAEVLVWGRPGIGEIRLDGNDLFFTDASEFPLSKVDLTTGSITPLAYGMRAVSALTLAGEYLLWPDFIGDYGDTGCAGLGVVRALVVANADGSNPHRIAAGDVCSPPAQESALSDGTYAYWIRTDANGLFFERVPLAGGAPERIAPIGFTTWTAFTLDATHIYWTESLGAGEPSSIKRCPLAGCGLSAPSVVSAESTYFFEGGIAVDDSFVYVGVRRDGSFAPSIARVPKTGGTTTDIIQDASARGLLSDGTNLYWWDIDNSSISQIETATITGGTPVVLASNINLMRGLAIGSTHVYWIEGTTGTNQNDGKIRRVPKGGGSIEDIKSDAVWPEHIQVEPMTGAVIYADGGMDENREQGIRRVALSGVATTIAKGIPASQPLAVDATGVYVGAGFTVATVSRSVLGPARTLAPAAFSVQAIEADGSNVYWLTRDPLGVVVSAPPTGTSSPTFIGASNGYTTQLRQNVNDLFVNRLSDSLFRFAKSGGLTDTLADDLAYPDDFVVDDSFVYVVESDARSITRIDIATKVRANVASAIPLFTGWWEIAHDAGALYLMSPETLNRYGKSNGAESTPYGPVFHDPFVDGAGLAVDDTHLYWSETLLGAIKRAPK